jgi:hypothetical protein
MHEESPALLGVDFTCAPSRRKPIMVARGVLRGPRLALRRIDALGDLDGFEALLAEPGPWVGGFDFPFGLPREFVDSLALGSDAAAVMVALRHRCPRRMDFRHLVDEWGNTRPRGQRLVHRRTDRSGGVGSTSPLQTRYVPVGFMYYEGMSRLLDAGVHLPHLREANPSRVALEAYPGRLAGELLGRRSYKNRACADRLIARKDMLEALEQGRTRLGFRLAMTHAQRDAIVGDASGDAIDAVLCLAQAAWATARPNFGLPAAVDPIEGWIVGE